MACLYLLGSHKKSPEQDAPFPVGAVKTGARSNSTRTRLLIAVILDRS